MVTELWSPRFVPYNTVIDCVKDLDYRILIVLSVVTRDCCKPMINCRDCVLSKSGLEVGPPAFQLPMIENLTQCRKEICSTCLFKESIPTIPFGNSKHPLPARSRFLRAAVHSSSSALWLHHAHPFVAAAEKTSLMQRSRGFGRGVVVSKICYNAVIALSVVLCDCCKPMDNC